MSVEEATTYLTIYPEFNWLTQADDSKWFKIDEVSTTMHIGDGFVRHSCDRGEIDGAINYGPGLGWRMPKRGLVLFFAQLKQQGRRVG